MCKKMKWTFSRYSKSKTKKRLAWELGGKNTRFEFFLNRARNVTEAWKRREILWTGVVQHKRFVITRLRAGRTRSSCGRRCWPSSTSCNSNDLIYAASMLSWDTDLSISAAGRVVKRRAFPTHVYNHLCLSGCVSYRLSLSIYIYIYVYICTSTSSHSRFAQRNPTRL